MIEIGEKVKRNPNYKGHDHSNEYKRKRPNYYTEVGVVKRIKTDDERGNRFHRSPYPVVEFPDAWSAGYPDWKKSLIRLDLVAGVDLEEHGFQEELFKI